MQQEKRQFLRHPIQVPIQLQRTDKKEVVRNQTIDLSLGGLCFYWNRTLNEGDLVSLTIPVEDQLFHIKARVAYSRKDPKKGLFRIGLVFENLRSAFRARLAEELLKIMEYREKISRTLGREISEEEAAKKWIAKYAAHFPQLA